MFESAAKKQGLWKLASLLTHALILWIVVKVPPAGGPPDHEQINLADISVATYLPPQGDVRARKQVAPSANRSVKPLRRHATKVDLSGIRLDIADDAAFEMLAVLRRYKGLIAFVTSNPMMVVSAFDPRTGEQVDQVVALANFFKIEIDEPKFWTEIAEVRKRYDIDPNLRTLALFPAPFSEQLDEAIANAARPECYPRVTSAVIRFSQRVPIGFVVERIEGDTHEIGLKEDLYGPSTRSSVTYSLIETRSRPGQYQRSGVQTERFTSYRWELMRRQIDIEVDRKGLPSSPDQSRHDLDFRPVARKILPAHRKLLVQAGTQWWEFVVKNLDDLVYYPTWQAFKSEKGPASGMAICENGQCMAHVALAGRTEFQAVRTLVHEATHCSVRGTDRFADQDYAETMERRFAADLEGRNSN